jgi:hypothetical protein
MLGISYAPYLVLEEHVTTKCLPSRDSELYSDSAFTLLELQVEPNAYRFHPFKKKLRGRSPQANYTDRATAACRRS